MLIYIQMGSFLFWSEGSTLFWSKGSNSFGLRGQSELDFPAVVNQSKQMQESNRLWILLKTKELRC